MFNGKVENEILDGEPGFFGHKSQLPVHLQLLLDSQQQIRDIWELPKENSPKKKLIKLVFHNSKSS
ncbi:hypothetical protein [Calothrix sp. NIES-2098]|uniref:hypothetical protein n=1 Tax=Calothrix sp. NIES-2098 TaxID=1954171 RepID=UPI000B600298|nr:hypothetical protein NIES2098_23400 [Calothrix sp. NIES-2098]